METYGIAGIRGSLALFLQDMGVGLFCGFIVCVYALFTLVWLAIEADIFDSKTATTIMQITELIILSFFISEVLVYISAYGPKIYFQDFGNYFDIALQLVMILWTILDIVDSGTFRVKGAYRVIRVSLLFFRLRIMIITFLARRKISSVFYDAKSPFEKVYSILSGVRDN